MDFSLTDKGCYFSHLPARDDGRNIIRPHLQPNRTSIAATSIANSQCQAMTASWKFSPKRVLERAGVWLTSPQVSLQASAWLVSWRKTVMSLNGVSRNVLHSCKTTTTKEEEPLRPRRAKTPTPPGVAREENEATGERENRWRRRRRGGTHEEDDDGGDADGRDEDPLVAVAASPQLPVHVHRHPRPPPL